MKKLLLSMVVVAALPTISVAQPVLILDCPVSVVSPIFDLAEFPQGASFVRAERYRFAIPPAGGAGFASTPRASSVPAKIIESSTHFQVEFENKRVVIDRMSAEFQLSIRGASGPLGGGTCTKLEERKF